MRFQKEHVKVIKLEFGMGNVIDYSVISSSRALSLSLAAGVNAPDNPRRHELGVGCFKPDIEGSNGISVCFELMLGHVASLCIQCSF